MSIDRDSLEDERIEVFARNNAQEIYKALERLEEHRGRYQARWLWELIQNARDAHRLDRRMNIEIAVSNTEIRFRHDGRPFARKEILSLIYHGSTKTEAAEPLLGKFGTGFLSTHLLSPTVQVAGTLDQPGRSTVGFRFLLDR